MIPTILGLVEVSEPDRESQTPVLSFSFLDVGIVYRVIICGEWLGAHAGRDVGVAEKGSVSATAG